MAYPAHTPLMIEAHRWMKLETVWGQMDCMLSLADWFWRVHGFDPAEDIRFTYDSPATCQRATGFIREPLAATRRIAEDRGGLAQKTSNPVKGDIALLRLVDQGREIHSGGLWLGRGWLVKGHPDGATVRDPATILETLAIWDMSYVDP